MDQSLDNPTKEKLDRVLTSVEWVQKFPLLTVGALQIGFLDHTLLLYSAEAAHVGNKKAFLFELSWFER